MNHSEQMDALAVLLIKNYRAQYAPEDKTREEVTQELKDGRHDVNGIEFYMSDNDVEDIEAGKSGFYTMKMLDGVVELKSYSKGHKVVELGFGKGGHVHNVRITALLADAIRAAEDNVKPAGKLEDYVGSHDTSVNVKEYEKVKQKADQRAATIKTLQEQHKVELERVRLAAKLDGSLEAKEQILDGILSRGLTVAERGKV